MTHDLICCENHYSVLRQCRCPGPKTPTYKACPYPDDPNRCLALPLYWNAGTSSIVRRVGTEIVEPPKAPSGMPREQLIRAIAEVLAGLQVPVSLAMPLGKAKDPWIALHDELIGFGWAEAADYEAALTKAFA